MGDITVSDYLIDAAEREKIDRLTAEVERLREALDSVCNRLVGSFGVGVASEMACEERWRALHPGEERGDE